MSEENNDAAVEDMVVTTAQAADAAAENTREAIPVVGYTVALTKDNQFVFEIFGEEQGLIQLLGIQRYAEERVKRVFNESHMSGDRLVHEVGTGISVLNQKMDAVLAKMAELEVADEPQGQDVETEEA
jgi:hypothetical protein